MIPLQRASYLIACASALLLTLPLAAQERELLSEEPSVILDLQGESLIELTRIRGTVSLRVGRPGELRYTTRSLDNRREERPVALWLDGRRLSIEPVEGLEEEALMIEIAASPELAAYVEMQGGTLRIGGLEGGLTVHGRDLDLHSAGLLGPAEIFLEGGKLRVDNAQSDLSLQLSGLTAQLRDVAVPLTLQATASVIELTNLSGIEATLDETSLTVDGVRGEVRVDASGGEISLSAAQRGAELDLDDAPLMLQACKGLLQVRTNAAVQFRDLEAQLVVESYGGSVRGSGNSGPVEVRTDANEVVMERIAGNTTVEGDELRLRLSEMKGETVVRTTGSTIVVERSEGALRIFNDFGDIAVKGAQQQVQIESRDGNVRAVDLRGPLNLKAEGDEVRVSWAELAAEGDATVENERGDVWVSLPQTARCLIDAQSEYGRIDNELREIRVTDDGKTAGGTLGRRNKPIVRIKSGRDVYLRTAKPPGKSGGP